MLVIYWNAAFWSCLSWSIWAFPAFNSRQDFQGEEGFKNGSQEGMLSSQILSFGWSSEGHYEEISIGSFPNFWKNK